VAAAKFEASDLAVWVDPKAHAVGSIGQREAGAALAQVAIRVSQHVAQGLHRDAAARGSGGHQSENAAKQRQRVSQHAALDSGAVTWFPRTGP